MGQVLKPLLYGIRVLDLTHMLAGPYGTMMLGDMGAEVIKIEPPGEGDPARALGPHFAGGESEYFLAVGRNKRSLTLNLKDPRGRQVFYDLVRVSDAVLDNFRPGVLERLECNYARLRQVNPRIVHCSISGFGQTGPYRDRPAFDLALQAMGGAMSVTGMPGQPPARMGLPMGDLAGGIFAAFAIAVALFHCKRTGEGAYIDLSLLDCQVALLTYMAQYYLMEGEVPTPIGSAHRGVVPYQAFATADGYLVVAVFTERFWHGFCRALGLDSLADDPRFADNERRRENREILIPILAATFQTRATAEWLARLQAEQVPSGPINTVAQILNDPHVRARGMIAEVQHPTAGRVPIVATPVKVAGVEEQYTAPPGLGQHTEEVLTGVLRYSLEKIEELRSLGVL